MAGASESPNGPGQPRCEKGRCAGVSHPWDPSRWTTLVFFQIALILRRVVDHVFALDSADPLLLHGLSLGVAAMGLPWRRSLSRAGYWL